ncbi:hypothetical protein KEM56_001968 [Ascosphaera pollenicola]|nr:hypothetical protein KEM56_001968 [Ascosphaera pollenicola]
MIASPPQPVQRPAHRTHPPPPPKPEPQAVVFEFLTPSSTQIGLTSGNHGGAGGGKDSMYSHVSAGDRYLFPANTILDYFPGGTTVIASFLAIKKVDEREPYVDLSVRQNVRGKYQKKGKKDKEKDPETPLGTDKPAQLRKDDTEAQAPAKKDVQKDEDDESKSSPCMKEYYQPVTMRLHASNLRILEPLAKIVNPPAQVRKYMDEIMDRLPRADIEYLALRLPREGSSAAQGVGEGKEE